MSRNYSKLLEEDRDLVGRVLDEVALPAASQALKEAALNRVFSLGAEAVFNEWKDFAEKDFFRNLWGKAENWVAGKFPSDGEYFSKRFGGLVSEGFDSYQLPEGLSSGELGEIRKEVVLGGTVDFRDEVFRRGYKPSAEQIGTKLATRNALGYGIPLAIATVGGLIASAVTKSSLCMIPAAGLAGIEAALIKGTWSADWAAEVEPMLKKAIYSTYLGSIY